jgi:DNA-binding response OmpR family regulator
MHAAGQAQPYAQNVQRLQPLRVVLAGGDRRFARVTLFLLSRRGYDVVHAELGEVVGAAERRRADVVLLEADGSRAVAGRVLASLQALPMPPAVLVVCDEEERGRWDGVRSVAKWTPLDGLVKEIEAASLARNGQAAETKGHSL